METIISWIITVPKGIILLIAYNELKPHPQNSYYFYDMKGDTW